MGFHHAPESVGQHLVSDVTRAFAGDTSATVFSRLQARQPACAELVCVVDQRDRLLGTLPLVKLFALGPQAQMSDSMDRNAPRVQPADDQESAASLALHRGVEALAVVDRDGRLLGVMPAQALLQVLRREHVEDLHRIAGIQREGANARHAMDDPPMRRVWHRLPWLLVGLAGSAIATFAMARFEKTLQAQIAVAFFVPALVYLADAIGTQTEAVAVRGLSLTRSGFGHLLAGELATGMLIGAILGALSFPAVLAAFGEPRLAAAVALALFAAGSLATSIGLMLPWGLARSGIDPAYGSGPLATILQDILTLLVYFGVVQAIGV